MAGSACIVHGGLKNNRSTTRNKLGRAWKPTSAMGAMAISGGTTSVLSITLIPQYKIEMSTSRGALQRESEFLIRKRRGERVMSARKPEMNVKYATVRPRIVRY